MNRTQKTKVYLEEFDVILLEQRDHSAEIISKALPKNRLFIAVIFAADVVVAGHDERPLGARIEMEDRVETFEIAFEFFVVR